MFLKYMTWICGPQLLVLFVEIIVPLRGRVLMEEISHGWWAFCVYGFTLLPSLFVSLCLSVSACLSTLPLSFLPLCFLYGSEMWFQFSGPTPKPCVLLSNRLWLYWTISQNKYFFSSGYFWSWCFIKATNTKNYHQETEFLFISEVSEGSKNEVSSMSNWGRSLWCCILPKNMTVFCSYSSKLIEAKINKWQTNLFVRENFKIV